MFFRKRNRQFTVIGRGQYRIANSGGDYAQRPVSVTLMARDHDDAEALAKQSFRMGESEWFPLRFLKVDRVNEDRR